MEEKSEQKLVEQFEKGSLQRDASQRLTYEINDYLADGYKAAKKKLAKEFGLFPLGFTIGTPDEVFQTLFRGRKRIGIEWDIWSGFIVVAKNTHSEILVREIAKYCEINEI